MPQRDVLSFAVGSSVIAVAVTFSYVGLAWWKNKPSSFNFPLFSLLLPVLFGLWNVCLNRVPSSGSGGYTLKMCMGGAVFGVLLSTLGSVVLDVPKKLGSFGWPNRKWLPLATAWVLYTAIWGVIVNTLNRWTGAAVI